MGTLVLLTLVILEGYSGWGLEQGVKGNLPNGIEIAKNLTEVIILPYSIQNKKKDFVFSSTLSHSDFLRSHMAQNNTTSRSGYYLHDNIVLTSLGIGDHH